LSQEVLKAIPLGGLGEIGMNCMVLEYQDQMIIIDCGVLFSDLSHFGVDFIIPDFTYILENRHKLLGIVLTHGHEDHIGGIPFLLQAGINVPMYAPPFTCRQIEEKLKDYGLIDGTDIRPYKIGGEGFALGEFEIDSYNVNHSIVDAAGLIIKTPLGKIVHTGDFKIDREPYFGKIIDLEFLKKVGDEGVLLFMADSTNVEKELPGISEKEVHESLDGLISEAQGLTLITLFSSNIVRLRQMFEIAYRQNKKIALSGRSLEQNVRLAAEVGLLEHIDSVLIGLDQIKSFDRKDIVVLATGSQGEYRAALFRIAQGEHRQIKLQEGDRVLFSSKFIPGNEKEIGRLINNLFRQGADVLYDRKYKIHSSGHASRSELKEILEIVKPQFFMPVHGEYRHLVHHTRLGKEVGIPEENIVTVVNGDIVEITKQRIDIVDSLEETRVMIEGRDAKDVSKLLLKRRRQLGEKGIVFALLVRDRVSRKILTTPEVIVRGLVDESTEAELVLEANKLVSKILKSYEKLLLEGYEEEDLQENVRIELRRFFKRMIGKKPIVLPMIVDL
jgi:ribonuclease J